MRYNRCWGTAIEILAIASLLQIPVYTYSPAGSHNKVYRWIRYNPLPESSLHFPTDESYPKGADELNHLELVHTGAYHYDCVVWEDGVYSQEEPTLRWRVTFRPRIVNIIISYDEGGAHDTTQYMAMVKIEFRIFAPNF